MYTLKSIAQRGTTLMAAIALLVGTVLPAIIPAGAAFADSLNPLTKRSLSLSSSSPGWSYTDGSGNSTYAPPNSGANGQKTGNTFSFNVSTDSSATGTNKPIQAMTFQYCTTSAGNCLGPGNDGWTGTAGSEVRGSDTSSASDLNVTSSAPAEVAPADFNTVVNSTGNVIEVPQGQDSFAGHNTVAGNYVVYYNDAGTWKQSTGWSMQVGSQETGTVAAGTATGKNNFMILTNSGGLGIPSDTNVKVVFFGTDSNYITNPGAGAFFVKINTYSAFTPGTDPAIATVADADLVDGGVTVANVMNQSIQITTKVLETMDFSVGTVDPDNLTSDGTTTSQLYDANGNKTHGTCDPVLTAMTPAQAATGANVLALGDQNAESSLSTTATYSTHSYWRLSSNSSAGATVYYSGSTLSNTEGNQIQAIGPNATAPIRGTPQFGLALANGTQASNAAGPYAVATSNIETDATKGPFENGADTPSADTLSPSFQTDMTAGSFSDYHTTPQLYPLVPETNYQYGAGVINGPASGTFTGYGTTDTQFAFDPTSQTIPVAIAQEPTTVVDCVTGKMRYIANIAATTPAGIYTTKVNYIASPQY